MLTLVTKYSLFALIATLCNLFSQYLSLSLYQGPYRLFLAIGIGTGSGLFAKYILDKKYIFYHRPVTLKKDLSTFLFYTGTGGGTTLLFWGTEYLFHSMILHPSAKYIGAVVGLSLGYCIKYRLDKAFVFRERG